MRVKQKTLTTLLLENKAPKYCPFLAFFLAGFPLLFLAYVVYCQRTYLDCMRLGTKRIDCQHIQEYNFSVSSRENFSLTHIKATNDYLLERIVEAKVEDYKSFLWFNYRRIILTLSNGEKIIFNSRLLKSISNGKREKKS